jgi:hypothetical protein
MKDNIRFYLHHEGQGILLIQHISSEYTYIAQNP